jgi:hypothetical protein
LENDEQDDDEVKPDWEAVDIVVAVLKMGLTSR